MPELKNPPSLEEAKSPIQSKIKCTLGQASNILGGFKKTVPTLFFVIFTNDRLRHQFNILGRFKKLCRLQPFSLFLLFSVFDIFTNQWQIVLSIKVWKSIDGMHGIWTWGNRRCTMEGTDKSTELWRRPNAIRKITSPIFLHHRYMVKTLGRVLLPWRIWAWWHCFFARHFLSSTQYDQKNRPMSIKVAQNDFTRKMIDFGTFTKIA